MKKMNPIGFSVWIQAMIKSLKDWDEEGSP